MHCSIVALGLCMLVLLHGTHGPWLSRVNMCMHMGHAPCVGVYLMSLG